MSSPYLQSVDAASPPDQLTPSDSASSPSGFAGVTPHGQGPAPYSIQAEMPDLSGQFAGANAVSGGGGLYSQGPRQAATEQLLSSAQGYGDFSITAGFSGEPGESWPNNPDPGGNAATPDQGMGDFTGTGTD
jgi:hypothetical protein